ncbi:MAG: hypothetical protein QW286_02595, partial [Candidatus Aenigmatarchaeota archaeon]
MFQITRKRLNIAFWAFFILSAAVLIAGFAANTVYIDVILSFLLIGVGFHGILEEFESRSNRRMFRKLDDSLQQLSELMQGSHFLIKNIKESQELRFHRLDLKYSSLEQRLDRRNNEFSKRFLDIENKIKTINKKIAGEKPKPMTKIEKRIGKAIAILRKEGMINISSYSRRLRVSKAIARNDLKKMTAMNIVKKRGKGRKTYFILAV